MSGEIFVTNEFFQQIFRLSIQLLGTSPNDAMLRQVTEANYIHTNNPELNAKEEWGNSNVPRTRFDQRSNESNLINNWQAIDSIH